jgi:putative protease
MMELLAPAGNLEKLEVAVAYGADAVYLAGTRYGLRAAGTNFTPAQLAEGVVHAHAHGVQVHLALNVFAHPEDFTGLRETVRESVDAGIDAAIVSDPGVFSVVREEAPGLAIHISTQASVTNAAACRFWHAQGARRVVLARELTLVEIARIRADTPEDLALEAFAHGSMCMSYSGRCILSNLMTGRDANRGRCAQPCRWKYALVESKRPGEAFPIEQDDRGTYVFNSRDLCMVAHLEDLRAAGIASIKIEGRARSAFYAAMTTKAYRMALDALEGAADVGTPGEWMGILDRTSHRPFSTGFFYEGPGVDAQIHMADSAYLREADVVGLVLETDPSSGIARVSQRNRFLRGERLALVQPKGPVVEFTAEDLRDADGIPIEAAPHPAMEVRMPIPGPVQPYSFLTRVSR